MLQRMESHIFLDIISKKILAERPGLPIYTIHDSIATTKENEGYISKTMFIVIEKMIGHPPNYKTEYWKSTTEFVRRLKLHKVN